MKFWENLQSVENVQGRRHILPHFHFIFLHFLKILNLKAGEKQRKADSLAIIQVLIIQEHLRFILAKIFRVIFSFGRVCDFDRVFL